MLRAIKRKTNINRLLAEGRIPSAMDDVEGERENFPSKIPPIEVGEEAVFYCRHAGGGGFGDPLQRDPRSVLQDVLNGFASVEAAFDIYGVAVLPDTGMVDREGTETRRGSVRESRLKLAASGSLPSLVALDSTSPRISEYVRESRTNTARSYLCAVCGQVLSAGGERVQVGVRQRDLAFSEIGKAYPGRSRASLRQFYCSRCGTILDSELLLKEAV